MPKEIDVSIIIPSFNTRDILRDCLSSIYCANSVIKHEVIVVDDCSSDDSVDMIQLNFPQVKLLTNNLNSGFSASCNKGIVNAEGRYLLLLNSDTVVFPDTLERLVAFADEYTNAGIIGCAHLDGKKKCVASYAYGFTAPRVATSNRVKCIKNGWVSGACMLLRQTALKDVGLLDENFFFGAEDMDLCWRMLKSNWEIYYTPDAQIIHYGGKSSEKQFMVKLYKKSKTGNASLIAKHGNPFQKGIWLCLLTVDVLPRLLSSTFFKRVKEREILLDTTKACFKLILNI